MAKKNKLHGSKLEKTISFTRPPIVTVMGHIDHGKTTLLDFIRKTHIVEKEHGGITQHIGAYQAEVKTKEGIKKVTFLDTPGHEAFEKMRSRGAQVADMVILVVAGNDGVMPQTIEAIKHIKNANVPMIVAINKTDLPQANIERVKQQLAENEVLVEGYGGDIVCLPISAKTGAGVSELLEMILLVAEMEELKADPNLPPKGVVIEAHQDKNQGPMATLLIYDGTLRVGKKINIGSVEGKVRAMILESGEKVLEAGPSLPVRIFGLGSLPQVGARLFEEKEKTELSEKKKIFPTLEEKHELKIILKVDTQGSLEAISDSLEKIKIDDLKINVVSANLGDIAGSDILLAASVGAQVLGFNVKLPSSVGKLAQEEKIEVEIYQVIYKLLEEMEKKLKELVKPQVKEEILGKAQIIAEFKKGKQKIAGVRVLGGAIFKGEKVRLLRGSEVMGETKVKSLKQLAEDISKVEAGKECGMIFDPQLDFTNGDIVECYKST